MFWRLGAISAWRNIARSLLAILSMAMAAAFLTNAISLSRGYAVSYRASYRSLYGGEIAVYDRQLTGGMNGESQELSFSKLSGVENTDLAVVMPELFNGYLTSPQQVAPLTSERLNEIAKISGVRAVYPRYQLPAMSSGRSSLWQTPLRGRDLELDRQQLIPPETLISEGRWFEDKDEGKMVAVVSAQQNYPAGQPAVGLGDNLKILLPRIVYEKERIIYNYQDPLCVELAVIGVIDIPTREVRYEETVQTSEGNVQNPVTIILYMRCDEIQIPVSTWQELWQLAGGQEFVPQQLSLLVDDMSYLEDIALTVQSHCPEYTVMSIPELLGRVENSFTLENPEKIFLSQEAADMLLRREAVSQRGVAMDLRIPLTILIFINAAMVIASNLLIMVNERRTEIGILKAVGARRVQIIQMILSEALLTSQLGALSGFLTLRLPAMFNQISNGTSFTALLLSVGSDLLLVLGVTGTAALIFGMLPALKMASLSVQEVLQSE